ncbi:uncharacterized protein METZ01_LOCUS283019, partial [marine metagenome]
GDLGIEVISSPSWISSISSKIETIDGVEGKILVEGRPKNEDVTKEGESDKLIIKITEGSSFAIATYNIIVVNTDDKVTINMLDTPFIGVEGDEYKATFKIVDIDSEDTVKTGTLKVYVDNAQDWLTGVYNEDSKEYIVTGTIGTELAVGATQSVEIKVEVEDRTEVKVVEKYKVEITGVNDLPVITGLKESYVLVEERESIITFNVSDKDSVSNLTVTVNYTDRTKLDVKVSKKIGSEGVYELRGTGEKDVTGNFGVIVVVTDEDDSTVEVSTTLKIENENDEPTIGSIPAISQELGIGVSQSLEIADVETSYDALDVSVESEVPSFSIETVDGIYTVIGRADLAVGSYEITVNVSDGDITASETTIINIEEILVAPVFVEPEKELVATEDEILSFSIVVTDNKVGDLG